VISSFPVGESTSRIFKRRDYAADYAYREIRAQFESQALLDRPCCPIAIAKLPDDLRTIPIADCGRRVLTIPCGDQRTVTIHTSEGKI
jgi:hypothetical protein